MVSGQWSVAGSAEAQVEMWSRWASIATVWFCGVSCKFSFFLSRMSWHFADSRGKPPVVHAFPNLSWVSSVTATGSWSAGMSMQHSGGISWQPACSGVAESTAKVTGEPCDG